MTAPPRAGNIELTDLPAPMDQIWDTIMDIGDRLPAEQWVLIGGQMVAAHGLAHGRSPVRVSRDIDILAQLLVSRDSIQACVRAIDGIGFVGQGAHDRNILHRFVRPADGATVDIVAPDHAPPRWPLTTIPPRRTVRIEGGRQALDRAITYEVIRADRSVLVPIPSVSEH